MGQGTSICYGAGEQSATNIIDLRSDVTAIQADVLEMKTMMKESEGRFNKTISDQYE